MVSDVKRPQFPCRVFPEDHDERRLVGLYEQRQEGYFMQRVKIYGGRLSLEQWKALAWLALRFTPGYPLHITTRQDIQLYGVESEDVPALQKGLEAAGLTAVGACGHSMRNITLCPGCGLCDDTYDLASLETEIRRRAEALPWIYNLPHKFKISLSGCENSCGRAWVNDLGLIANPDGTFRAVLAGSLRGISKTGLLCYENLAKEELLPLTVAALRFYNDEGDRQKISRARLRYVRERLGDDAFRRQLDVYFQEEKAKAPETKTDVLDSIQKCEGPTYVQTRLFPPRGNIEAREILTLADILETTGGIMRIGFEHDLCLYGIEATDLPVKMQGFVAAPHVLACPGSDLCKIALVETWDVAEAVREALPSPCPLMVGISGCPNACSYPTVADIGLVGRFKKVDGERRPHYRLLAGGGRGASLVLGLELHPALPKERVAGAVAWLVSQWGDVTSKKGHVPFEEFIRNEKDRLSRELETERVWMAS